jgi:peptidoglycan hydrolase-like protein with peptidoglycan-binding domain
MKRGKIILLVVLLLLMAALLAFAYYKRNAKNDSLGALTFGRPDEGEWILRLQKALNYLGYGLAEDGIFGYATERAVVEYFGTKTVTAAQIIFLENDVATDKAAAEKAATAFNFQEFFRGVLVS